MNGELLGIFAYIVCQFVIGSIAYKFISSENDYFLGGRQLGPVLATFSIFATWFGAETCIGSAAEVFQNGLSGSKADPWGYAICLLAMSFMAARLWKGGHTTLGDLFRTRYSEAAEKIIVFILVPSSLFWAAAQVRAFGQILSVSSTFGVEASIMIAASVVILYTVVGGLLADAITDLVQGAVLMVGLVVLLFIVLGQTDSSPMEILSGIESWRFNVFHSEGEHFLEHINSWMIPILGSITTQELISRVLASRSPHIARRSSLWASVLYLFMGAIPVVLALLAFALKIDPGGPEQVLPFMAQKYLPKVGYILFSGALVSAILSTVDSTLLAISSLVSHNVIYPLLKSPSEKTKLRIARGVVILAGVLALVLALMNEGIYELVEAASAFGGAGPFVVLIFALFSNFGGKWSAVMSMVAGAIALLVGDSVMGMEAGYVFSFVVSLMAYVGTELAIRALPILVGESKKEEVSS